VVVDEKEEEQWEEEHTSGRAEEPTSGQALMTRPLIMGSETGMAFVPLMRSPSPPLLPPKLQAVVPWEAFNFLNRDTHFACA
jgi:hypothetical protein